MGAGAGVGVGVGLAFNLPQPAPATTGDSMRVSGLLLLVIRSSRGSEAR